MKANKNATELLKDYFFRCLLIQQSAKMLDENWGKDIIKDFSHFVFTDPLNIAVQTEKNQVAFFNKLLGTSDDIIRWKKIKSSKCTLDITEENKKEIIEDALSQIYCNLSVTLFENLIALLKNLSSCNGTARKTSFNIINEFYDEFKNELTIIDQKKIDKTKTILVVHNLRIFRNKITHTNPRKEDVDKDFDGYNLNIQNGDNKYSKIQELGELRKELFYYSFNSNLKIFLCSKSFNGLLDFYSQIAYIAYLCYCNKFKHNVEI